MSIFQRAKTCGRLDFAHPGRYSFFLAHDERMRSFRRAHGGIAGLEIAVKMRLPLYTIPATAGDAGGTMFISATDLPELIPVRRLPLHLFPGN